jgi:hypothetical protein
MADWNGRNLFLRQTLIGEFKSFCRMVQCTWARPVVIFGANGVVQPVNSSDSWYIIPWVAVLGRIFPSPSCLVAMPLLTLQ